MYVNSTLKSYLMNLNFKRENAIRNSLISRQDRFPTHIVSIFFSHSSELQTFTGRYLREQFIVIHRSTPSKTEQTLNRPIIYFYNRDDANVSAADLRFLKTRKISFYKENIFLIRNKSNRCKSNLEKHMLQLKVFLWLTVNWELAMLW